MEQSQRLYDKAQTILVGGVNSPVRAFKSVGGTPLFFNRGYGAYLTSADGDDYLDYVLSWGPMILGHADSDVLDVVTKTLRNGVSFGAPTELETVLAQLVNSYFPSMERVRFVNSGTEACMSAIRLARGFTGRKRIVKFDGCYHGHADSLLVAAGSGGLTLGTPDSAGVLPELARYTTVLPYNDSVALRQCFAEIGSEIAAVIVEPVAGNMGVIVPDSSFLVTLRDLCTEFGALLIFDEVMTGFRVSLNGAQGLFGITPDLTCLGKVVGGGMPCAAYGGRADVMIQLSPCGPVYQAGTLSGNPVAMASGIATLSKLKDTRLFNSAVAHTDALVSGLRDRIQRKGIPATVAHCGTMWTLFFNPAPVRNLTDAMVSDRQRFARYYHAMLGQNVYLAPSQFESNFVSACHGARELDHILNAFDVGLES